MSIVFTDGGSRKLKEAACAAYFLHPCGEHAGPKAHGRYLGQATNNEAEYSGLILALEIALAGGVKKLQVFADSLLIVNQVNGEWALKKEELRPYWTKATLLAEELDSFSISWVPREENKEADAEVNRVLNTLDVEKIWSPIQF